MLVRLGDFDSRRKALLCSGIALGWRRAMEFAFFIEAKRTARADDSCNFLEGSNGWSFFVMLNYIWIMLGGALGTGARYWASGLVAERFGEVFPLGTLFVNVTGSFVIGFFAAVIEPEGPFLVSPRLREFVMIGFCGGYTTFSSYSLQTLELARDGDWLRAGLNSVLSLVCCFLFVWLGRVLGLLLLPR
jgi:CrcB protein